MGPGYGFLAGAVPTTVSSASITPALTMPSLACGGQRHVADAVGLGGAAVVDAQRDALVVLRIGDLDTCAEGQRLVRHGHRLGVVALAAGGLATRELLAVPGELAGFGGRRRPGRLPPRAPTPVRQPRCLGRERRKRSSARIDAVTAPRRNVGFTQDLLGWDRIELTGHDTIVTGLGLNSLTRQRGRRPFVCQRPNVCRRDRSVRRR